MMSSDQLRAFDVATEPASTRAEYGDTPFGRGCLAARRLIEAGLLIQVEGKEPYDRFRGRLMIPIRDPRGRVIAFGGRIIGEGEPKYLNSPDTPLFDKGRTLYNLDRAAAAARKADRLFVVEGYMDAVALAQHGIGEAVARAVRAGIARIIVEVDRIDQIEPALAAGATHLLLDNMAIATLTDAVAQVAERVPTEASGGVRLDTIGAIAATGVTYVSVGRLTQSAPAVDIGLDFTAA